MAIWDALSGKIYRWNQSATETSKNVAIGLSVLDAKADRVSPELQRAIKATRNLLYAYYEASVIILGKCLKDDGWPFKEQIYNLNWRSLRFLIGTFHTLHVVRHFYKPDTEHIFEISFDGIKTMYDRNDFYVQKWRECANLIRQPDRLSDVESHIVELFYGDVATILGLPLNGPESVACARMWFNHETANGQLSMRIYEHPGWSVEVDQVIRKALSS